MLKGKTKYGWLGIIAIILVISTYCIGGQKPEKLPAGNTRADIITIDTLKVFGYLEKPQVIFFHDAHTKALEKKGKDCSYCHLEDNSAIPGTFKDAVKGVARLSIKFKRLEDRARKDVMDVYHKFCIECHTQMTSKKEKTGPITCGGCHDNKKAKSSRIPMGMDKNLHFRHVKAYEKKKNCETCHHEYNPETKKLFYAKGKEGTCRYCHKKEKEENRISMREAAHIECISCHKSLVAKKQAAGPVKCAGCHDPGEREKIKKIAKIKRLERNQPDEIMVSAFDEKQEPATKMAAMIRMNRVPFNHKAHEKYNDTCRVCHHESMDKCSRCHTLKGSKDAGFVKLADTFHAMGTDRSCLGCHELNQQNPKCAGCHVFMEKRGKKDDASCLKCHENITSDMIEAVREKDDKKLAMMMIKARKFQAHTFDKEDIPQKVVIKELMNKYQAVEFPHGKIVAKLVENIKDNKMATYFHTGKGQICQGCHHNAPQSKKPPKCSSCHGKPFDKNEMLRPGLMGAFHQQCMTCHKEMKLDKPAGCTGCHKEK